MFTKKCLLLGLYYALASTANAWHVAFMCVNKQDGKSYNAITMNPSHRDRYNDMDENRYTVEAFDSWSNDSNFPCKYKRFEHAMVLNSGNDDGWLASREFHLVDEDKDAIFFAFGETKAKATDALNAAIAKRANFQKVTFSKLIEFTKTNYNPVVKPTAESVSEYIRNIPHEILIKRLKRVFAQNDAQKKLVDEIDKIIKEGNWPELTSLELALKLQKNKLSSALLSAYLFEMEIRAGYAEKDLIKQKVSDKDNELKETIAASIVAADKLNFTKWNFYGGLKEEKALLLIEKTGLKESFENSSELNASDFFYHQFFTLLFVMIKYNQMTHQDFIDLSNQIEMMK